MGVDTDGRIGVKHGIKDVQRALKHKFNVESKVTETTVKGYCILSFNYREESRDISVFENYVDDDTGELETHLSFNKWGSSVEIMRGIIEMFGGYIKEDDCVDEWEYVSPNSKINLTEEEILEDNLYIKLNDTDMNFVDKQNIVKYVKENLEWIKTL